MERSTNSVLNFDAITAEEITNAAECVLWLLKGTGSDRDKQLTLAVLREWLQGHMGDTTIDGKLTLSGLNGTAELTNALFKIITSERTMELKKDELKFYDDALNTWTLKIGRNGLSMLDGLTEIFKVSSAGAMTLSDGSTTVNVSKNEVKLTKGFAYAKFYIVDDKPIVEVGDGTYISTIRSGSISSRKVGASALRIDYPDPTSKDFTSSSLNATDVVASLTGVSKVFALSCPQSILTPSLFLNHSTPPSDYEIVVDFQSENDNYLTVKSGSSGSSTNVCRQAANTVRKYRYNGSSWECLY